MLHRKRKLIVLLLLLLTLSTPAYPDCITYQGGLTECTGPGGYQSSQREYQGGLAESWDNRGNRAEIRRHTGGYTSVVAPTGRAPSVSAPPPQRIGGDRELTFPRSIPYVDPFGDR